MQFYIIGRLIKKIKYRHLLGNNGALQLEDLFLLKLRPFLILFYTLASLKNIIKSSSL